MRKLKDFELEFKVHKNIAVHIRKDSYDEHILKAIPNEYNCFDYTGQTVLDIGGCFGGFSMFALSRGAAFSICCEPDPFNCELINKNIENTLDIELISKAVVGDNSPEELKFYQSNTSNMGINCTTPTRGRNELTVKTIPFIEILEKYKPSIIKIDCEGGEYDFMFDRPLPEYVKHVVMEIHLTKSTWRTVEAPKLISMFDDFEWDTIKKPNITEKNWHTLGAWSRA